MATARLRAAFRYPADNGVDDLPDHMDEEEQEALIAALRSADDSTNELYSNLFSIVFVLPAIYFLFRALATPTLINFLSLSSLTATIYTIRFIPIPRNDVGSGHIAFLSSTGPIDKFLPILNGLLAAIVGVNVYHVNSKKNGSPLGRTAMEDWAGYLPIAIWVVSMIVRYVMKPLDLDELEKMKYKYKGA
ncbi:hypothetical protein BDZ91DRAFT_712051 [Kalaharituber pfeilii]|nr:hypothetical protein BDZ91DRAFT_712051 [Kalaharituber pfeilii]